MGEVYRGYDTKLQRAVAIKVLPDFFAEDANRLARFEEEARALAALNHPHVGAIYGLEESAGVVALVLELVRPSLKVDVPKQLFNFRRPASLLEVSSDGRFLLFVPHVRAGERPIVVDMAAITSTQR
jgi:serine/threonine protein kinase